MLLMRSASSPRKETEQEFSVGWGEARTPTDKAT